MEYERDIVDEKRSQAYESKFESDDEDKVEQAVGSTNLFENGEMKLIPMPTPDPKDPLNLSEKRKWIAIGVISFFGSLALAAEIIIGSLIPVFLLEYSGVDPHTLNTFNFAASSGGSINFNPLSVIPPGVTPAPIEQVSMLATIPLLTNGIASYFLVPLSIGIGRRPVMLLMGVCAWVGGLWAGLSSSLYSHLAARALMGLGAGAVEALIPLIIQDMMFIHQRNKAMSTIVSSQGIIIISLGIAAPYVAAVGDWRWLYFITSGAGIVAWILMIAFLPETRWKRSKEELSGQKIYGLEPGEKRPRLDPDTYGPRTFKTTIGLFQYGFTFKDAGRSMLDTLRTTFFPAVVWATLGNSAFVIINQAAQQLGSFALLAQGWQFKYTGLIVLPFVLATVMVYFLGGPLSDKVSLTITKWHGGVREPEYHLPNLIIPFFSGVIGCFIFGYAAENNVHWAVIMAGSFFIIFAFLTVLTVINVYMVESYPMWAGPVLVNVSSMRLIIAFFFSSTITTWVIEKGFLGTFAVYAEALIVLSLGIPALYFTGKKIRIWTAGSVEKGTVLKKVDSGRSV
ncbi:major facilitator superfamily transporter [Pseudomassariella vexata]|uniref:Major facilitator superfamily transporter n=1 Tax=Pseudomassariella vexata TaxID=1141098 RepID=A0A1Y2DX77_9PEZI|nr:major facilitator superfamily transporter [Pseudomassariella vexata]ORY63847.1 major facilitator superfamily transporter [Pseudomassariella vexata]